MIYVDLRYHSKRREPLSSWGFICHNPESPSLRGSHVLLACQIHKSEVEKVKKKKRKTLSTFPGGPSQIFPCRGLFIFRCSLVWIFVKVTLC